MSDAPPRVRFTGPEDLVAAVPLMLGFRPTDSLVVMTLRGPRGVVGLMMRYDLPEPADVETLAMDVGARLVREDADGSFVVVYDASHAGGELPHRELVDLITGYAPALDAVLVVGDRMWSYLCDEDGCCPPGGRQIPAVAPGATHLAAEQTALGIPPPAPSREDIERWLEPAVADDEDEEARSLAVLAGADLQARDGIIADLLRAEDGLSPARAMARHAAPADRDAAYSVLAAIAYAGGNGTVARIALDHCSPDYPFAEMLRIALSQQVPPSSLREAWLSS